MKSLVLFGFLGMIFLGLLVVVILEQKIHLEELKNIELKLQQEEEKERKDKELKESFENFIPYLIRTIEKENIYDEEGNIVGELPENTFYTIIFENGGRGQLFSGEGWVDLTNVIKNPVRNMQASMKVVANTPLKNGPGIGYKTLGEVKQNEIVEVNDIFGVWYKVKLSNDVVGYVYYKNLR